MNQRDKMPKSVKRLWRKLLFLWASAWLTGLVILATVVVWQANQNQDQQLESKLRIQAIAVYGLAFLNDQGEFESDLLSYESDLFEREASVWFVEPFGKKQFHLGENDRRLARQKILDIAEQVVETGEDLQRQGTSQQGNAYRLLAIPTYRGTSEIPTACIIVAVNPASTTRAKWWLITITVAVTATLGVIGIGVGAWLAGSSLRPLSGFISRREQFLSAAAHELRTPLASIRAILESAAAGNEPPADAIDRLMPLIERESKHVNDLLVYARLTEGQFVLDQSSVRLDLLVEKCIEEESPIQLTACESTVHCDSKLVEIAIQNLLSNAVRHAQTMNEISIVVDSNSIAISNPGDQIPAAVLEAIERRDPVVPSEHGSGLGLPTVQMIMDLHGGSLKVANKSNSSVELTLGFRH